MGFITAVRAVQNTVTFTVELDAWAIAAPPFVFTESIIYTNLSKFVSCLTQLCTAWYCAASVSNMAGVLNVQYQVVQYLVVFIIALQGPTGTSLKYIFLYSHFMVTYRHMALQKKCLYGVRKILLSKRQRIRVKNSIRSVHSALRQ